MVIGVVILALLTIMGVAATTTSSIELQIAGNDKIFKQNLYFAEGAAMMLARILENQPTLKDDQFPSPVDGTPEDIPVKDSANDIDPEDILKDTYWEGSDDKSCEAPGLADSSPSDEQPKFIARKEKYAGSLDMSEPTKLYEYTLFGRRKKSHSAVVIELGYRKRF